MFGGVTVFGMDLVTFKGWHRALSALSTAGCFSISVMFFRAALMGLWPGFSSGLLLAASLVSAFIIHSIFAGVAYLFARRCARALQNRGERVPS
jgi:hypothetical protein